MREQGATVRVTALADPRTAAAIAAARRWSGPVESFPTAEHGDEKVNASIVVDCVFGTGLSRPIATEAMAAIDRLVSCARLSIAVDLPSGVDADTGAELNRGHVPNFDVTLALGALKPAHVLQPAAAQCGTVRLLDIGLGLNDIPAPRDNVGPDYTIERPYLQSPQPSSHKYNRGMVVVIAGAMPGAATLAVQAAMRAGAGYGLLLSDADATMPHAVVRRPWSDEALSTAIEGKTRVSIVVGPGLGRDADAEAKLAAAIATEQRLVIDGDALHLLNERHFETFRARSTAHGSDTRVILTPHEGEFKALFGDWEGSKIEAGRAAARQAGATVVFKGPDTVVAHPNGWTNVVPSSSPWLSTAGTGDVLAGIIGATYFSSSLRQPAEAAVWMHAEAARRLGGAFIADDLARELSAVRASL